MGRFWPLWLKPFQWDICPEDLEFWDIVDKWKEVTDPENDMLWLLDGKEPPKETDEELSKQKEYPRWFKYKGFDKIIIEFLDLTSGIVVDAGTTNEAIGTLYTGLWPHTNSDVWQEVPSPELTQDNEINNTDGKRKQIGGDHYAKHTIQPWDIIREYELDFFEGSCISYILRRKNNRLEDLQKAAHYLEECIKNEQKRIDNV